MFDPVKYIKSKHPPNSKVLDIGCVGGTLRKVALSKLHAQLCEYFHEVIGIDYNKKGVNLLFKKGYKVYYRDAQKFNLKRKFDIIVASNIVEHLENLGLFLDSIKKHMHKDTNVYIWTPNAYNFINFLAILIKGKRNINEEHCHWHSLETLRSLLERKDLEIKKIIFFNSKINGGLINRISLLITYIVSFFRPAFSDSIFIEAKLKK